MSFFVHGAALALVWFLAINLALSALVAVAVNATAVARLAGRSPSLPFMLRLLPAAAAAAFVAGVFAPAYWRYEPRDFAEGFNVTLTILAASAGLLLIGSGARGVLAWWRAVVRTRVWTETAEPLGVGGVDIPVFRIDAQQPVMALVGILRPRLLVTSGLIDALTPEEMAASLAHEIGHQHAWDNLKRLAMIGAPDVLRWTPAAHRLEHQWAVAAEYRADAAAADLSGRAARLALASALVKVARLMPVQPRIVEPISTLIGGGEVAARVKWLIDDGTEIPGSPWPGIARFAVQCTATLAVVIALGYTYVPMLETVHLTTEILVHHLP